MIRRVSARWAREDAPQPAKTRHDSPQRPFLSVQDVKFLSITSNFKSFETVWRLIAGPPRPNKQVIAMRPADLALKIALLESPAWTSVGVFGNSGADQAPIISSHLRRRLLICRLYSRFDEQ
jgi:hypothetical protein